MERGQDYIYEISNDGGLTFTKVGKLQSASLTRSKETTETNNFDSPDDAESIATMKSWGISAGALYVYDDAGQLAIEAAFAAQDPASHRLTSAAGTVGVFEFEGAGHVTELELEFETNEVVKNSISVEGTGPLTRQALV